MKYECKYAHSRIGSMQYTLFATIVWALAIVHIAIALPDARGLRGVGITENGHPANGTTLYHRRVSSNPLEEASDTNDQDPYYPTLAAMDSEQHRQTQDSFLEAGLEKLIIGGSNAGERRYPWFTRALGVTPEKTISACGGSLIAPDIVITAAHCDDPNRVMVGPYDLDQIIMQGIQGDMVRRAVTKVVRPDGYPGEMTIDYDVMLLKLEEPVLEVTPIRVNFNEGYPSVSGEELLILGHGSILGGPDAAIQQAEILQKASTSYVPFEECAVAEDPDTGIKYGLDTQRTAVEDYWLCTLRADTATCFGDSGGPVIKEGANAQSDLLLGVISGASSYCGNPYLPLFNNRVSWHQDWIKKVGCELSTLPPEDWNCSGGVVPDPPTTSPTTLPIPSPTPPPTNPPIDAPTDPPVPAPTNPPTVPPIALPTDSPTAPPTGPPTVSPAPTISFAPTEVPSNFFEDNLLYISIGAGVAALALVGTIGYVIYKRRRKSRVDDIDQHTPKKDVKPSKSKKDAAKTSKSKLSPNKKKSEDSDEPSTSSPATSIESEEQGTPSPKDKSNGFFSKFSRHKPPQKDSSVAVDPESQQKLDSIGEDSSREDGPDISLPGVDDSPNKALENPTDAHSRKRFFPSLFKVRKKPNDGQQDDIETQPQQPLQVSDGASEESNEQGTSPEDPTKTMEDFEDGKNMPSIMRSKLNPISEGTGDAAAPHKDGVEDSDSLNERSNIGALEGTNTSEDSPGTVDTKQENSDLSNEEPKNKNRRKSRPSFFRSRKKENEPGQIESNNEANVYDAIEGNQETPTHDKDARSSSRRKRFFPSLFRAKDKSTKVDPKPAEAPTQSSVPQVSETKINESNQSPKVAHIPQDTASMAVQIGNEADDVAYETASMVVLADKESRKRNAQNFAFPRINQPREGLPVSEDRTKSNSFNTSPIYPVDDDIKAIVHQGRESSPMRSNVLDRTKANDYANQQLNRMQPRRLSQARSEVNDFVPMEYRRSRSTERSRGNEFASGRNHYSRPTYDSMEDSFASELATAYDSSSRSRGRSRGRSGASNYFPNDSNQYRSRSAERSEASRVRSRSKERSRANKYASRSKSLERSGDPPGEVYADRLIRPTSYDRTGASNYSKYNSDKYGNRRRSSSLDRSRATNFAKHESDKYEDRKRPSSLDRSHANEFAYKDSIGKKYGDRRRSSSLDRSPAASGNRMPTNTNPGQKQFSSQKTPSGPTTAGGRVANNDSKTGVVITKNPDGSIVHAVKRRRADGALVTTKTKFANAKLARKYGLPV